jgi:GT2 family glycosyltransferase
MASDFLENVESGSIDDSLGPLELSVIIVNWNAKDHLLRAISSIESGTSAVHLEIIVIDSGSFDGCGEAIQKLHPRIRFIQSDGNIGFAKANNQAFQIARGETLLFLNPDTEVHGDAIQTLYTYLNSFAVVGVVGPKLLSSNGSIDEASIRAFPTVLNQVLESNALRKLFPRCGLWGMQRLQSNVPGEVDAVSGACLMVKRKLFEKVGMFSTHYFMYSEDMDLCLKVRQAGFSTHYVPSAVVVHHGGASSSKAEVSCFATVMLMESRWRFFRNTRSIRYAAVYRLAMLGASLMRVGLALLAWPLRKLPGAGISGDGPLKKWLAGLRWTLGGEQWVKRY